MRLIDADVLIAKYPECRGLREKVRTIPTARQGFAHWGWCEDTERYDCSRCTYESLTKHNYCPYCGANMMEDYDA